MKLFDVAIMLVDKALALEPDNLEALNIKSNALYQFEKYEDAIY